MRQVRVLVSLLFAAVGVAACTHDRNGPPEQHFAEFHVAPPDGNAVEVCHAYTCQMKIHLLLPSQGYCGNRGADEEDETRRHALRGTPCYHVCHWPDRK